MSNPIEETERLYRVKLPDEYKAFLQEQTYKKFSGQYSNVLSGGRGTFGLRFFVGASIDGADWPTGDEFAFNDLDDLREEHPGLVPFAAFDASGDIDSGALAIDVKQAKGPKCPVFQCDDGELEKVADSIREFLTTLSSKPQRAEEDGGGDDDDDEPNESGDERERAIRKAMERPTTHVFSDQDKTPQGQKAISLGIKNRQEGRAGYDYTKAAGADFAWPDLDPARIGNLEPWLCYGAAADAGWLDLNTIPNGRERRGAAAFQCGGYLTQPPFDKLDTPAFKEIDRLLALADAELAKEVARLGVKYDARYSSRDYFVGMKRDFEKSYKKIMGRAQKGLDVANQFAQAEMNKNVAAAKAGGALDPVQGVALEDWAAANAKMIGGMALEQVLRVLGVEKPAWDAISAEWNARMARDSTFAVAKVYGDAFTNSNIGKFAQGGAAAPMAAGSAAIEKIKADFELYVKVMTHQSVGASQGISAAAVLAKYGLTVADWAVVGGYWGGKLTTDMSLALKMGDLMARFTKELAAPKAGDDLKF